MAANQFYRYGVASGLSFCMSVALAEAFRLLEVSAEAAFAMMLATMTCINFTVCRVWVFRGSEGAIHRQFATFVLSALGFRSADFVLFLVAYTWAGAPYTLTVVLVLGISAVLKFIVLRRFVFRRRPHEALGAQARS
jgi:putative flippase GtrA